MGWENLNWFEVCDEVSSLKRFLTLDNEEAVSITISSGTYSHHTKGDGTRVGFVPDMEKTYLLEELSGGELIELGRRTLSALVEDRLYYIDTNGVVCSTGESFTLMGECMISGVYECVKATINFSYPVAVLPEEEVLSRKSILVRDNRRVKKLYIYRGCMGIGGSNTSGFSSDEPEVYSIEELDGAPLISVEGNLICAIVGDVVHLVRKADDEPEMYTIDYRSNCHTIRGSSIAYDTISATRVILGRN